MYGDKTRAKTAESIEMPFGAESGGPKEPLLDTGADTPRERVNFQGCPAH